MPSADMPAALTAAAPQASTVRHAEIDQQASSLGMLNQHSEPLSRGRFAGSLSSIAQDEAALFRESLGQGVLQTGCAAAEQIMIAAACDLFGEAYWNSRHIGSDAVIAFVPGREFALRTPVRSVCMGISISTSRLAAGNPEPAADLLGAAPACEGWQVRHASIRNAPEQANCPAVRHPVGSVRTLQRQLRPGVGRRARRPASGRGHAGRTRPPAARRQLPAHCSQGSRGDVGTTGRAAANPRAVRPPRMLTPCAAVRVPKRDRRQTSRLLSLAAIDCRSPRPARRASNDDGSGRCGAVRLRPPSALCAGVGADVRRTAIPIIGARSLGSASLGAVRVTGARTRARICRRARPRFLHSAWRPPGGIRPDARFWRDFGRDAGPLRGDLVSLE